jgi:cytochrome c oxidase subunit 2
MLSALTLATVPPLNLSHESAGGAIDGLEGLIFRGRPMGAAAAETDSLFMLILWFSTFFFVLLMGLMIYWGFFKYRRRPGVPAPRSVSHNGPLEIFWTVVPSSALLVIFLFGLWTYTDRQIASGNAINLTVKAWKWGWGVTYPNGAESQWALRLDPGGTQQVPVFVVPQDTDIAFTMISQDVIHSFWIPDFRVKMDVFPNRYTGYTFRTPTLPADVDYEDHWIFCAEYCGDLHSDMAAVLRVVRHGDYVDITENKWATGDLTPVEIGQRVYVSKCATCHSVDGSGNVGPTWKGLYGADVPLADGRTVKGDENYIRESILEPGAKLHAGYANQMPSFQGLLNDAQLEGLIAYIRSLGDGAGGGETPPAEGGEAAPGDAPADQTSGEGPSD